MQDLRSKLLAAGVVTQEQVSQSEKTAAHKKARLKKHRNKNKPASIQAATPLDFEKVQRDKLVADLKNLNKNEQYETIRRWVDRNRLDKAALIQTEELEKYFFNKSDDTVTWLSIPVSVADQIRAGTAGIMAYMSNHGLAHCVVGRDIIEDVTQIFPEWVRVLLEPGSNSTDA